MTFYIAPPSGFISLQRLTQFAHTRFTFLCKILETKGNRIHLLDVVQGIETVEESECLIEGSCKDRISHAMLRLACCEDPDMSNFMLMAETLLFDFRFSCMTKDELHKVFRSTDHYRKSELDPTSSYLGVLSDIRAQHSSWREVVKGYLMGEGHFCTSYLNVLPLVARREVVLDRGVAHVPFHRLREVVTEAFRRQLSHGLKYARAKCFYEDERIENLVKSLKVLFRRKFRSDSVWASVPYSMLHTQIDSLVDTFPPCMAHLHRVLRTKHRLSHHARIQYTLFLKEAGLPVHEALMFWRAEYSQEARADNRCGHNWAANERRYIYSIRHLYGLEGSRINYRGHSCTALQENYHGVLEEGGCPFSRFDKEHLEQLFTAEGVKKDWDDLLSHASHNQPSLACTTMYNLKMKNMLKEKGCTQEGVSSCKSKATDTKKYITKKKCTNCSGLCLQRQGACQTVVDGRQIRGDQESLVPKKAYDTGCDIESVYKCLNVMNKNKGSIDDKLTGALQENKENGAVLTEPCCDVGSESGSMNQSFCHECRVLTNPVSCEIVGACNLEHSSKPLSYGSGSAQNLEHSVMPVSNGSVDVRSLEHSTKPVSCVCVSQTHDTGLVQYSKLSVDGCYIDSDSDYTLSQNRVFVKTLKHCTESLALNTDESLGRCKCKTVRGGEFGNHCNVNASQTHQRHQRMECDTSGIVFKGCSYGNNFSKPLDFYLSYNKLLRHLQSGE